MQEMKTGVKAKSGGGGTTTNGGKPGYKWKLEKQTLSPKTKPESPQQNQPCGGSKTKLDN